MDRPFSGRQRAKLDALDAALFDERDRVLKIVMRVLRAVGCKDAAHRHRLAVDGLDNAELVRADLDQRHFLHDALDRIHDKMKSGFEHVGLDADLAVGRDDAALRHPAAKIAPLFDADLFRADVDEKPRNDVPEELQAQ